MLARVASWRAEALPEALFLGRARASRGVWPETLGFAPKAVGVAPAPVKPGEVWEVLFGTGDDLVQKALLSLRARAARDGVDLRLRPVEGALLEERLRRGAFDLVVGTEVYDPHPWAALELVGGSNLTGWSCPGLQGLLATLDDPLSPAWERLHAAFAAAPGSLPLLDLVSVVWVDRRLKVSPGPLGLYFSTPGVAGWTWNP